MVDDEFYEKILRKFENDDTIKIFNIDVKDACEKGNNFVSNVQRLFIRGLKNDAEYKTSLIVKTISNSIMAKQCNFDAIFKNEVNAYREILPELQKYSRRSLNIPACLYVDDGMIVIQDMSNIGYANIKKGQDFTIQQCEIVLVELAKLHAASLTLQENNKEFSRRFSISDIYGQENSPIETEQSGLLAALVEIFDSMPSCSENQNIIKKLKGIQTPYNQISNMLIRDRKVRVFNHGDTWGNNILFKNGEARLIDYQLMRFTSVAADLNYFLYINIKPSVRAAHIDTLLVKYLDFLRMYTKENGSPVTDLTIDWLKAEMREFALFGFISALWILPVFYLSPEDLDVNKPPESAIDVLKNNDEYKNTLIEYAKDFCQNLSHELVN